MTYFIDVVKENKTEYRLSRPGKYVFFLNNYSGNLIVKINSENVKAYLYGVYTGRNKDVFRLHTTQHHQVGKSFSDLLIKSVLYDESKLLYEGLIKIDKKAQQSQAYQKNQSLVMSDKCFVDSRPDLEILANDVFCTHGSTIGQPDKEQINYLLNRGIAFDQAQLMIVDGFLHEVKERIQHLGIKNFRSFERTK
jgi:Fe-S cluster assembly protein SufD